MELGTLMSYTVPLEVASSELSCAQSKWLAVLRSSARSISAQQVWDSIEVLCEKTTQRMQL